MSDDAQRRGKCRRGKRGSRGRKKNPSAHELPRAPVWAQGTAWNPRVQAQPTVGGAASGTGVFIPGGTCSPVTDDAFREEDEEHFDCDLRELLGNLPEVWEY